ncbi:unnamed protein product [Coregonus sp. 'balchen']|nr:unnamed protein product [Coregonus sp. 'balchen']
MDYSLSLSQKSTRINNSSTDRCPHPAMKKRHRQAHAADTTDAMDPHLPPLALPSLPFSASGTLALPLPSPATRRSISMGDFKRVTTALYGSEPPSTATTAPFLQDGDPQL